MCCGLALHWAMRFASQLHSGSAHRMIRPPCCTVIGSQPRPVFFCWGGRAGGDCRSRPLQRSRATRFVYNKPSLLIRNSWPLPCPSRHATQLKQKAVGFHSRYSSSLCCMNRPKNLLAMMTPRPHGHSFGILVPFRPTSFGECTKASRLIHKVGVLAQPCDLKSSKTRKPWCDR